MNRKHNNADKRVYRILHTQGEFKGRVEEIHGRAFYQGVEKGALILDPESGKFARVAAGWLAHVVSKTEVAFLRFVQMVSNWDIIAKVFKYSGKLSVEEKDRLMRAGQPLISAEQFKIGEKRIQIGPKKAGKFARRVEYASTQPVY